MTTPTSKPLFKERNQAVTAAFLAILNGTKELLHGVPQELLRYTIEMEGDTFRQPKLLEFVTPLCYLSLQDSEQGYQIQFGFDQSIEFTHLTSVFIRMIYRETMRDRTPVSIEDCVAAHTIVTDTAGLFDYLQWKHPSWPIILLSYKPSRQKKPRKAVV